MGLPEGWVTAPQLGLPYYGQLHLLGNGVVPQQAAIAVRMLLDMIGAELRPPHACAETGPHPISDAA
ncbi:hypothetical protein [Nocardia terpenica]|uniref:hypothetical protein n=1 Tax=Nocardia terpenica TaxID=455432 RepID=UPI0018D4F9AC|nr:hypothetical protein [Nocardia terpenica]